MTDIKIDSRPQKEETFDGAKRKFFFLGEEPDKLGVARSLSPGECKVYLPQDPKCTKEVVESMKAYRDWLTQLLSNLALQSNPNHVFHKHPYKLESIDLQAPTWFGPTKIGFLMAQCIIKNDKGESLPAAVFLRGGSVGILIIIQPEDAPASELYSILAIQPRIAAGSFAFAELPAGMLDESSDVKGAAIQEIQEEVGFFIKQDALFNMSEAAVKGIHQQPYTTLDGNPASEQVADSMYPSPGGCDEFLPLMLLQKRLSREDIENLKGKETGLREEGENITLKVVPFDELWKHGGRDGKCLAALGLYENLKRAGALPSMPSKPDTERPPTKGEKKK